jgi:hypothetical protein
VLALEIRTLVGPLLGGSLKLKSDNRRECNVFHINNETIDYTNGQETYIKEAKIRFKKDL